MLRIEPPPSSAKPHVSPTKTRHESNGPVGGTWKVTMPVTKTSIKSVRKPPALTPSEPTSTREPTSPREQATSPRGQKSPRSVTEDQNIPEEPQKNATKVRTVETWLNDALTGRDAQGQKVGGGAKRGLTNSSIDPSSLDSLGLDPQACERIYRALMVYSQGIHMLLDDSVKCSGQRSQALLVLWKAFTAVLEHAAPGDKSSGGESFSALMQKGNADQMAQIELQYKNLLKELEQKVSTLTVERRDGEKEIENLKNHRDGLESQTQTHLNENETIVNKYELEIRQRMAAETRFLEKQHWAAALEEDLHKAKRQVIHLSKELADANEAKEALLVDNDYLKTNLRSFEVGEQRYQQQNLETSQQKLRFENMIEHLTGTNERYQKVVDEMKIQLSTEVDENKKNSGLLTQAIREQRKMETAYEDEVFARSELQKLSDDLQVRVDKLDKETATKNEEGRLSQKEISDLKLKLRTDEIELKRKREQVTEMQRDVTKLGVTHQTLVDEHRSLRVESDYLREDVANLDEQLKKETDLRRMLQLEKKRLLADLDTCQSERDTSKTAAITAQKEMMELTKKMMKMESIVRQCEQAKSKLELEHSVERRAHAKKIALLEKVISDEREARRELVSETTESQEQAKSYYSNVKELHDVVQELKNQRREWEEEADRCKLLVGAQERRVEELLQVIDRHHASTANHDSEMREMQVLLENEREESKRQMDELKSSYAKGRYTMEQRIDAWQMRFEDALSLLHFNPATQKIQKLQQQNEKLEQELLAAQQSEREQKKIVEERDEEIEAQEKKVAKMQEDVKLYRKRYNNAEKRFEELLWEYDKRSMGMADMEEQADRLMDQMGNFDAERESLEDRIQQLLKDKKALMQFYNKQKHDAIVQANPRVKCEGSQTDLSYQYLDTEENMQGGPRRREQLNKLNNAGHYAGRDGTHNQFSIGVHDADTDQMATQMQISIPQVGMGQSRGGLVFNKNQTVPMKRTPAYSKPSTANSTRVSTTAGSARPTTQGTQGSSGLGGTRGMSRGSPGFVVPQIQLHKAPAGFTPEPWDDVDEDYDEDY